MKFLTCYCFLALPLLAQEPETTIPVEIPIKVLIIDGQNNHNWKATTPILEKIYAEEGNFDTQVSTSPPKSPKDQPTSPDDEKWSDWHPNFNAFDVVVSNYNGELWPESVQKNFEEFVREGGGFVSVHAADNAFPDWKAYNEMTGIGGWEGRKLGENGNVWITVNEDGTLHRDAETKGNGGAHGPRREFLIQHMDSEHPILEDLPEAWLHTKDELYCKMCGPAENLEILGHAKSNLTNKNEPILMALTYGEGRIFHTTLGHDVESMNCRGFYETLQRGTEWAADGTVFRTAEVPNDFPTKDKTSPVTD